MIKPIFTWSKPARAKESDIGLTMSYLRVAAPLKVIHVSFGIPASRSLAPMSRQATCSPAA